MTQRWGGVNSRHLSLTVPKARKYSIPGERFSLTEVFLALRQMSSHSVSHDEGHGCYLFLFSLGPSSLRRTPSFWTPPNLITFQHLHTRGQHLNQGISRNKSIHCIRGILIFSSFNRNICSCSFKTVSECFSHNGSKSREKSMSMSDAEELTCWNDGGLSWEWRKEDTSGHR